MASKLPSAEFRDGMRKLFFKGKLKRPEKPSPLPIHDKPSAVVDKPKMAGDPMVAYSAQQIYNPQLPPAPPKPPTQVQANRGTVGAMDTSGPWGQPGGEK